MCPKTFQETIQTTYGPMDICDLDLQHLCSMRKIVHTDRQQLIKIIRAIQLTNLGIVEDRDVLA